MRMRKPMAVHRGYNVPSNERGTNDPVHKFLVPYHSCHPDSSYIYVDLGMSFIKFELLCMTY